MTAIASPSILSVDTVRLGTRLVQDALKHKRAEFHGFSIDIVVNEHDIFVQTIGVVGIDQLVGIRA